MMSLLHSLCQQIKKKFIFNGDGFLVAFIHSMELQKVLVHYLGRDIMLSEQFEIWWKIREQQFFELYFSSHDGKLVLLWEPLNFVVHLVWESLQVQVDQISCRRYFFMEAIVLKCKKGVIFCHIFWHDFAYHLQWVGRTNPLWVPLAFPLCLSQ